MKTLVLLMTFTLSLLAQSSIHFNKGWQLSGVATELNVSDVFNNDNIELIWAFNASTQKWEGYASNSNTQAKINKQNFATLKTISPSQGFWIKSKESWHLTLNATASLQNSNNQIQLMRGWNLVSLGEKASISPTLFGDDIVWKYSDSWKFFSASDKLDFPTINALNMGEGFWVKTDKPRKIDLDKALSQLHTFKSVDKVKKYIRDMKNQNDHFFYAYGMPMPLGSADDLIEVPASSAMSSGASSEKATATDTTQTNLQESGVDESDILKHNNEHLFFYNSSANKILITSYKNLVTETNTTITPITLEKHSYLLAMYLQNSHLIIITQNNYYDDYFSEIVDGVKQEPSYDATPSFNVINYDVNDSNNIKKMKSVTIDGYFSESRITNGKLYVISRFYPQIIYDYAKKYVTCSEDTNYYSNEGVSYGSSTATSTSSSSNSTMTQKSIRSTKAYTITLDSNVSYPCYYYGKDSSGHYFMYDYTKATIKSENLLPKVNHKSELIRPSKFYAPYKLSQTPTITSITTFTTSTNELNNTISFVGNANTIYMTPTSLYISSREYPIYYSYNDYIEQETIYHFSLEPLAFISKGSVRGNLLSSYSLSEYHNTLRVATTEGGWWRSNTKNSLFTLQDKNNSLQQVGELTGLGEESERIKAVRFYGNKGFLVTFKRTDPLYTIDLSDAKNPKKVGELHVNGYSEYLHLVDANTLLSFGRDADSEGKLLGLQIQLFDIRDFANPSLLDKVSVGDRYTYSELSYNPSMFIYRDSDKKFAIPYRRYNYSNIDNYKSDNYMGVFDINNSTINKYFTLELGSSNYSSLRGIIYDYNNSTYTTMFSTDKTITKKIGD